MCSGSYWTLNATATNEVKQTLPEPVVSSYAKPNGNLMKNFSVAQRK
jgi:hypothetical protein